MDDKYRWVDDEGRRYNPKRMPTQQLFNVIEELWGHAVTFSGTGIGRYYGKKYPARRVKKALRILTNELGTRDMNELSERNRGQWTSMLLSGWGVWEYIRK